MLGTFEQALGTSAFDLTYVYKYTAESTLAISRYLTDMVIFQIYTPQSPVADKLLHEECQDNLCSYVFTIIYTTTNYSTNPALNSRLRAVFTIF